MMMRCLLFLGLTCTPLVTAQLRPRRVGGAGVSATGQQEDVGMGGDDAGSGGLENLMNQMGGGAGGLDMAKIMESMGDMSQLANNPMLKGLADANPEIAEMMNNPEVMKEKMAEMQQLFASEEGQNMAAKMMEEMQSVLTDPEKLQQGLQQLAENPALKGLADAVPGLADVLNDPEQLAEQSAKTAEMFQKMQDPAQMQELMGQMGMGDMGNLQESMAEMMKMLQSGDSDALAGLMGGLGGGDAAASLKDRVDRLMSEHGMPETAAEVDEF
mmetsp:Transcript_43219/g.113517  ORF Transcript_43219/g.113517 Transcript_43219/m.113517 type:complete len:271 (+) Transcript_43219:58-870(+)